MALGTYKYDVGYRFTLVWGTDWKIIGSNDNSTWDYLDQVTNAANTDTNYLYSAPISGSYRYVRIIFNRLKAAFSWATNEIRFGFSLYSPSNTPITNVTWVGSGFSANFTLSTSSMFNHTNNFQGISLDGRTTFPLANIPTTSWRYDENTYVYTGSTTTIVGPIYAPPGAPTSLSGTFGNQQATISFTPGPSNNGTVTNYSYSLDNGVTYVECNPPVISSPIVITGLTNGINYQIRIFGINEYGNGTPSNTIAVTPHTVPDAPTNLIASYNGSGSVSISFTPGTNGGMTISNYQYSIDCGVSFTPLSPIDGISPVTISGLTNGQTYCIELKAVNTAGAGIASSSVEYTASGLPGAPTSITWSDVYNGTISVSFVSGSSEGSPITNYQYSLNGGSTFTALSPATSSSPITITGLTNRTDYSLVLKAVNANGAGASSASLALYYMCFLEGTKILCYDPVAKEEIERPIESLRKGDLVKTTMDGYKAIDTIGASKIYNPANSMRSKNRLYKCSKENYPELKEDLVITGCHAVLVKELSDEERKELIEIQGKIYVTEDYYRLIACVDKRAQPYEKEGIFNIWHFALENDNYYYNYGVFANGLKVETASKRMMKEMSGMDLIQ